MNKSTRSTWPPRWAKTSRKYRSLRNRPKTMTNKQDKHPKGFRGELRLILQRAWQVWNLISRKHKVALIVAALLMALTSACNTALPLMLGQMVDAVQQG